VHRDTDLHSLTPHPNAVRSVSLLTPVHRHDRVEAFLTELYTSIQQQDLPAGWTLEWVVREDGEHPVLGDLVRQIVGKDPRVVYGANHTQGGPAITRTQAFHDSCGEIVLGIDHDDYLEPGGLRAMVEALVTHPRAAWVTGKTFEMSEQGEHSERETFVSPGYINAGHTLRLWNTEGISTPWYPTATAYRRSVVAFLGGWPANIAAEDTELLACITAGWDGVVLDTPIMTRRRWSGQITKDPIVEAAAGAARRARHQRATLIHAWRQKSLLGAH
jgi:glycosyltransferase involved in cell wall biosynthesis